MQISINRTHDSITTTGCLSSGAKNPIKIVSQDAEDLTGPIITEVRYKSNKVASQQANVSNGVVSTEINTNTDAMANVLSSVGSVEVLPVRVDVLVAGSPNTLIGSGDVVMVINTAQDLPTAETLT